MSRIPFVIGNLLLDADGDAWAVYRVPTVSFPLLGASRKLQVHAQLMAFAASVRADFTLWRVTRGSTPDDRQIESYVAVRLPSRRAGITAGLASRIRQSRGLMPRRLRLASTELSRLAEVEAAARMNAVQTLDARPATSVELTWLLARSASLGISEPGIDPAGPPAPIVLIDDDTLVVEPCTVHRFRSDSRTHIELDDTLELRYEDSSAFHALLTIGVLPDGLSFPGRAELLSTPLEAAGTVVDAAIHAQWISNARALKRASRSILEADHSASEQLSTGQVADSRLSSQLGSAVAYKQYLESDTAPPMLRATLTLRVAARTRTELDATIAHLRSRLAPAHVTRPRYVQRSLWQRFDRPGGPLRDALAQPLTPEQFAALVPHATECVGTESGPVIGRVRTSERPVRLDLRAASATARPPSVLCVGTLGSGKTMTSQLLALHALRSGSLVVDVDPKPDHALDTLPELAGRSTVVDLADVDRHAGLLDPLAIADPALRDEVAASFYADLVMAGPRARGIIRATLATLPAGSRTDQFLTALAARPEGEAADVAEQLRAWTGSGLARLALAERTTDAERVDADLVSIRCRALTLPSSSTPRTEYTDAERVSVAIVRLIATYAMRLVLGSPERHKVLLIDEAWLLLASSDGRALIDRINRTGRSENATLLLATQQLGDTEHIAALIGTHLVFGVETAQEARLAADLLGLDGDDDAIQMLTTQRAGQAVMRDTSGRLARVQIEPGSDLLSALSTTPTGTP